MRHGKKVNHLGRTHSHRKALLSNLATALITHKRITTTVAKAKALRVYVEPLLTKAKSDTTHSRRVVFSYLQDKEVLKEVFGDVATKIGSRPGGYTRIIRLGFRPGDNAEMALIELVDYNENLLTTKKEGGAKKKRTRRGGSGAAAAPAAKPAEAPKAEAAEEAAEAKAEAAEESAQDQAAEDTTSTEEAAGETDTKEEA